MLDQTVIQMSPQLINISHIILIDPLIQHCRDSVTYVLKSEMLESTGLGAIIEIAMVSRDKAARWLCVHGALVRCTIKT